MTLFPTWTLLLLCIAHISGTPHRSTLHSADATCSEEHLQQCALNAEPLVKNPLPDSPQAMRQFCSMWTNFATCIKDYSTKCMSPSKRLVLERQTGGSISSMSAICENPEQQNEYFKNAPCVKKISTQESFCGKQYQFLIDHISEGTSFTPVCCARAKFLSCLYAKTPAGCGSDRQSNSLNSTRLAVAILDNSLAFLNNKCESLKLAESDCPGMDNFSRFKGSTEFEAAAASGESGLDTKFQLDQPIKPASVGFRPSSATTKELKDNSRSPVTGQLSSSSTNNKSAQPTKPRDSGGGRLHSHFLQLGALLSLLASLLL